MSEPKPLTKRRREQIENWLRPSSGGFRVATEAQFVRELLAAEQFWREAVKNADVCGETGVPCPWCEARTYDPMVAAVHLADCEYRKARE